MAELEHRACIEIRAIGRTLTVLAAPYGVRAHIGGFDKIIVEGAFRESLNERNDVLALLDHDMSRVLARTKSGSLRLAESKRGLEFEADLPSTSWASDALELVRSNNAGGMSFGFRVRPAGERWDKTLRELRSIDLVEISVVSSFPVYDGTEIFARSRRHHPHLNLARRFLETI